MRMLKNSQSGLQDDANWSLVLQTRYQEIKNLQSIICGATDSLSLNLNLESQYF